MCVRVVIRLSERERLLRLLADRTVDILLIIERVDGIEHSKLHILPAAGRAPQRRDRSRASRAGLSAGKQSCSDGSHWLNVVIAPLRSERRRRDWKLV